MWLQQLSLSNDDIKFVDMKTSFCRHCESSFESRQKAQVKQHIESAKHKKNMQLKMKRSSSQAQLEDVFERSTKKSKSFDLNKNSVKLYWHKLQVPMFRKFLKNIVL
ncbi:Uncharacterized protein FKW44_011127, partial [Caligus rogercresseyi]